MRRPFSAGQSPLIERETCRKALAGYTEAIRIDQELAEANRRPEAERSDAVKKGVPLGTSLGEAYLGRGSIYSAKADNEAALHDNEAALGE